MSRLASHLSEHPASTWLILLEYTSKFFNLVIFAAAATAFVFCTRTILDARASDTAVSWWLWVADANALVMVLLSFLALLAVSLRSLGMLAAYGVFTAVAMAAQLCLAVLLIVNQQKSGDDQGDDEGRRNLYKLLWLIGYGVEAFTLAATCLLQGAYQRALDLADDLAAEEASWAGRQPLLPGHRGQQQQQQASQPTDDWSARMHERYGLDTSQFTYRPGGAGDGAARAGRGTGAGQAHAGGTWCAIM